MAEGEKNGNPNTKLSTDEDKVQTTTDEEEAIEKRLKNVTFEGVLDYIKSDKCKNIITMVGAGISTSAGIPDFRSPGTGLYDNLQKYDLPTPQAIFDINYFQENPEPFFFLAKELWPGTFKPTPTHYFIRLLEEKGLLLRHLSQNIDTLEHVAGISADKIVEAHGTFHSSHCTLCKKIYSQDWIKEKIFSDTVPRCENKVEDEKSEEEKVCNELVKPDIVFFGEQLPYKFFKAVQEDIPKCDLLIIMGTSLLVQPFAGLISRVPDHTPRVYFNMEKPADPVGPFGVMLGMGHDLMFGQEGNYRDVYEQGACDDSCQKMADALGWGDELRELVKSEHARIDMEELTEKMAKTDVKDSQKGKEAKESGKAEKGNL